MPEPIQNPNDAAAPGEDAVPEPTQVITGKKIDTIAVDKRDLVPDLGPDGRPLRDGNGNIMGALRVGDDGNILTDENQEGVVDFREGNYNSGKVVMGCVINDYCPFETVSFSDQNLVFNWSTIQSVPEYVLKGLSGVEGGPGIFLKEQYFYHSQYLYINDEPLPCVSTADTRVRCEYEEGGPIVPSTCEGCVCELDSSDTSLTTYWLMKRQPDGSLAYVDTAGNASITPTDDQTACRKEYEWDLTKNVFMAEDTDLISPSEYSPTSATSKIGQSRWTCIRKQRPLGAQEGQSGSDILESCDGEVIVPAQGTASATASKGIHWRVEKRTRLFRGEDFFVELVRTTESPDVSNIPGKTPFVNYLNKPDVYKAIDVYSSTDGSNAGVVQYEKKAGEVVIAEREREVALGIDGDTQTVVEDTRGDFDFSKQAYFIIEMGLDTDYRYFIIIPQKASPRFIKVINGKSYFISEYGSVSGEKLLDKKVLRIEVRNHLGRIVVKFTGYEDKPWVIGDIPISQQVVASSATAAAATVAEAAAAASGATVDQAAAAAATAASVAAAAAQNTGAAADAAEAEGFLPPDPFCVPGKRIALWGGNMPMGFLFSPIQYTKNYKLELPPPNKEEYKQKGKVSRSPFVVPGDPQILFSQRDMGLSKGSVKRDVTIAAADPTLTAGDKRPFYTADVQEAEEFRDKWVNDDMEGGEVALATRVNEDGDEEALPDVDEGGNWTPQRNYTRNPKSYFMDSGTFVKEKQDETPSRITIGIEPVYDENGNLLDGSGEPNDVQVDLERPDAKYLKVFNLSVNLEAGSHTFDSGCVLHNCKTPVITNMRLVGITPTPVTDRWPAGEENTIDAGKSLMSYNESWSAQDYNKMEHTGSLNFLVNRSNPTGAALEALRNKAFYVQIFVGYIGCNYSKLEETDAELTPETMYKLMSGICYGGTITEKAGERIMQCKVVDYSQIFKDVLLFNSPFFDGVRDINVIYELGKMVGFKENNPGDPLYLIRNAVMATAVGDEWGGDQCLDGRSVVQSSIYALPSGYAKLQGQTEFKFTDGSTIMAGLEQVSKRSGKPLFFDADGMLHYEAFPIARLVFGANQREAEDPVQVAAGADALAVQITNAETILAQRQFDAGTAFASKNASSIAAAQLAVDIAAANLAALNNPNADAANDGGGAADAPNPQNEDPAQVDATWYFTASPLAKGQIIFNAVTREIAVNDVFTNIHVETSTPFQELVFADRVNSKGLYDPTSEGFMGYLKTFLQMDGIFGSDEAAKNYANHLTKFFRPPVIFKFETFGEPLRAFDVINVDNQLLVVISVSQTIDAKDNKWWMTVEGEWLFGESGTLRT